MSYCGASLAHGNDIPEEINMQPWKSKQKPMDFETWEIQSEAVPSPATTVNLRNSMKQA